MHRAAFSPENSGGMQADQAIGLEHSEYAGDGAVTKPLPFTAAGIARAIRGVQAAGKHVIGVRPDGTLIVGDNPIDTTSLGVAPVQDTTASKWEDERA
jgi:hypothetical protein